SYLCFGRNVAGHESPGGSREPAVGEQSHGVAEPFAHQRGGHAEHLAHSGPALWAFVTDDDDVSGFDPSRANRTEGILLAFEDARRTPVAQPLVACDLHHAALGRKASFEDHEATGRLEGPVQRHHYLLAGRFLY